MTDQLFADTNLLIYAMDRTEPAKRDTSADLLAAAFRQRRLVLSPQILNESYWVLTRRRKIVPPAEARDYLASYLPVCTAPLNAATHAMATAVEIRYRLSWWDCVALASALQARCGFFVSEDIQDGQVIESLRVVNPFVPGSALALALNQRT